MALDLLNSFRTFAEKLLIGLSLNLVHKLIVDLPWCH